MKILFVIIFTILSTLPYSYKVNAASYHSIQKKCKQIKNENPAKINVFYNFGTLRIDEEHDSNQVKTICNKNLNTKLSTIYGCTLFNEYNRMNLSAKMVHLDDDYYCVYPESINYFIGYENSTIYLSSNLKKNSCNYNIVKRHEEAHIDFAHTILLSSAVNLKKKITQITQTIEPIISDDHEVNHAETFTEKYNTLLRPTIHLFRGAIKEQNKKLDDTENYKYESSLCNKE